MRKRNISLLLILMFIVASCAPGMTNVTLQDGRVFETKDIRIRRTVEYLEGQYDSWVTTRKVVLVLVQHWDEVGKVEQASRLATQFNDLDLKAIAVHDTMVDILDSGLQILDTAKRDAILVALFTERKDMANILKDFEQIAKEFDIKIEL